MLSWIFFSQFVCTTFEWICLNVLLWILFSQHFCSILIELCTSLVYGPLVLRHSRMHLPGFAWKKAGQFWTSIWTNLLLKNLVLQEVSTACRQLLRCGCMSTPFCSSGNCKCKKAQLSGTALCKCDGQCSLEWEPFVKTLMLKNKVLIERDPEIRKVVC